MRITTPGLALAVICLFAHSAAAKEAAPTTATTDGLASVYSTIADSILAAKASEGAMVRAILEHERDLAFADLDRATSGAGMPADLRAAATHVGNFATEGGAVIEPIRNRLLQGGHHHHADDKGPEAVYDEGYVVLNKKLKQEALELAKRCAKAGEAAKVDIKEAAAIREALSALATRAITGK